jgi:hypothetical protein
MGSQGAPGSKVQLTPEPAGPNCPAGGQRIDVGVPADGGLAVEQTAYVCNGVSPPDGSDGGAQPEAGTDAPPGDTSMLCSTRAIQLCLAKGWTVSPWSTSFPNSPGGSIFCVNNSSPARDCDTCATYNEIVWKSEAVTAGCGPAALVPGMVYGGYAPCLCSGTPVECGSWDMQGCIPD